MMGKEVIINKIKTVAVNIRKIREFRNYTQEYLAIKLDISQNAYSKIELGYTKITLERLYQIAQILDVDLIELIKADGNNVEKFINMPSAVSA
ncbi:helix-turn-helix transcriptional regulator [Mucilaginibacter sp. CSA2-8R]|jgi:transcriptional regulator with XRE-family HTH domain|uniref:helix-turn-helix domain-containing protein n=1 Tax=Mucilaginibacter sp. CSA2-8R TaxID=3141542 RepID=UPI00315CBD3C